MHGSESFTIILFTHDFEVKQMRFESVVQTWCISESSTYQDLHGIMISASIFMLQNNDINKYKQSFEILYFFI